MKEIVVSPCQVLEMDKEDETELRKSEANMKTLATQHGGNAGNM